MDVDIKAELRIGGRSTSFDSRGSFLDIDRLIEELSDAGVKIDVSRCVQNVEYWLKPQQHVKNDHVSGDGGLVYATLPLRGIRFEADKNRHLKVKNYILGNERAKYNGSNFLLTLSPETINPYYEHPKANGLSCNITFHGTDEEAGIVNTLKEKVQDFYINNSKEDSLAA